MDPTEVASFRAIEIVPYTDLLNVPAGARTHRGGPIWPHWNAAGFARHHSGGTPVDRKPKSFGARERLQGGNLFWAGAVCHHFGHQIMDFSTRLMGARAAHPGARLCFGRLPSEPTPAFFAAIMDWLEVECADRLVLDRPVLADALHVVPQGEQVHRGIEPAETVGPSALYLDLMDAFMARKRLAAPRSERRPVFLTRAGVERRLAGEAYLEWAAARAGALVVRPETRPLPEQIALALSARTLIVSEGSALHLLSLAGRGFGDLDVLISRPSQRTAYASLAPRTTSLAYTDLLAANLCGLSRKGAPFESGGLAILDEARVLDHFHAKGIDMRPVWSTGDFADWVERDLRLWTARQLTHELHRNEGSAAHLIAAAPAALAFRPALVPAFVAAVERAAAAGGSGAIAPTRPSFRALARSAAVRARRPRLPAPRTGLLRRLAP